MYDMKDNPIEPIKAWIELHQACFLLLSSLIFLFILIQVYRWLKTVTPYLVYLGATRHLRFLQIGVGLYVLGLASATLSVSGVLTDTGYYTALANIPFWLGMGMMIICLIIVKRRYLRE